MVAGGYTLLIFSLSLSLSHFSLASYFSYKLCFSYSTHKMSAYNLLSFTIYNMRSTDNRQYTLLTIENRQTGKTGQKNGRRVGRRKDAPHRTGNSKWKVRKSVQWGTNHEHELVGAIANPNPTRRAAYRTTLRSLSRVHRTR